MKRFFLTSATACVALCATATWGVAADEPGAPGRGSRQAMHARTRVAPTMCQPAGQVGNPNGQWQDYPGWRWDGDPRWQWDGYPRWLWHG